MICALGTLWYSETKTNEQTNKQKKTNKQNATNQQNLRPKSRSQFAEEKEKLETPCIIWRKNTRHAQR